MDPTYENIPEEPTPAQLRTYIVQFDKNVVVLTRSLKRLHDQYRDLERAMDDRIKDLRLDNLALQHLLSKRGAIRMTELDDARKEVIAILDIEDATNPEWAAERERYRKEKREWLQRQREQEDRERQEGGA